MNTGQNLAACRDRPPSRPLQHSSSRRIRLPPGEDSAMPNSYSRRAVGTLFSLLALCGCENVSDPSDFEQQASLGLPPTLNCRGVVGGGVVGNVEVKRGEDCILTDVIVRGSVKVLEGATLTLIGGTVRGNVEGDKAFTVAVRGTKVDGNVQIQESRFARITDATIGGSIQVQKTSNPGDGVVIVGGNAVAGNIQIEDNFVLTLEVSGNLVLGNLQVVKNVGGGGKLVAGNQVAQNLQCGENSTPFIAVDNSAGEREGQCMQ